jgi:hypothetical protein
MAIRRAVLDEHVFPFDKADILKALPDFLDRTSHRSLKRDAAEEPDRWYSLLRLRRERPRRRAANPCDELPPSRLTS